MIENEIIGDKEKGFDFTETISPEVIETPNYDYGRSQEPLDFNRLKNKPSGGGNYYTTLINRSASSGTGDESITGVGFQPNYIKLTAYRRNSTQQTYSIGTSDGTNSQCMYCFSTITQNDDLTDIININYTNEGGSRTRATFVSFDSDGFTLNYNISAEDISILIECFG